MASEWKGDTILTADQSAEVIAADKKRHEDYLILRDLCEAWYVSLVDASISHDRAIKEITSMMKNNITNGLVTERTGWQMIGEYAIKCSEVTTKTKGPKNGIPSDLVRLLINVKRRLPNPVRDRKNAGFASVETSMDNNVSIYDRHSARLAEFGLAIKPSTLKKWFENKRSPKSRSSGGSLTKQ